MSNKTVPSYLADYADIYQANPKQAALTWFTKARYGLFMHYGLYSILGRGEWAMYHEAIPVREYEKLKSQFTAENFDADAITDLAIEAGMKYVNITTRHHDSFCLFKSDVSDYTSTESPARRDLIEELANACAKKGLGFFMYYSYGADWHHPYFMSRERCVMARPNYPEPDPAYKWQNDADFSRYMDFVHAQIRELLTHYGPVAGIWFDPIMPFYAQHKLFPIHETYALIRELQPQTLISFKQGATGDEDFAAPERSGRSLEDRVREKFGDDAGQVAADAWSKNKDKYNEICDTLQPETWGYDKRFDGEHKTEEEVLEMLVQAQEQNCNLLLNTGPLPDGSIHPIDSEVLRSAGQTIRKQ